MQTALIAGGAGFIGSHLCRSFLKDKFFVVCVDNLLTGNKENIKDLISNPNFEFINHDVTRPLNIDRKIDFIFHLASPASPSKKNPKSYIHHPVETLLANSVGTHELLELSKRGGSKFLFASSSEVYGDPEVSPQKEDYFGNVNPIGIRSVYDEGKRFGEAITMSYFRKVNLNIKIVRIFNTYGPNMPDDGRVVTNFLYQAFESKPLTVYGDGKQTRSFCYVDDMVKGLEKVMFSDKTNGEVINLGNPNEITVLDIAEIIKKLTHSNSKIIFEELPEDDPKRRNPDITKAKKVLDWEPKVSLEEGLEKMISSINL